MSELDLDLIQSDQSIDSGRNVIAKSNSLVRARQHLTLQERRLIYMFISMIRPDDKDFRVMRLSIKDIAKFLGISKENYYTTVKQLVVGLQKKGVYIRKENSTLYVNWLSSSEYYNNRGIVEVEFSNKMKPYLLELKKEYTRFKLSVVITLDSVYSMQMYELLKQNLFRHSVIFTLQELKTIFDMKDDTYQRVSQFKERILNRAKKELKKKTDISYTYEDIKKGRQIVAFNFKIYTNDQFNEGKEINLNSPDQDDKYDVLVNLMGFGVSKLVAQGLIEKYSDKRILANISYVKSRKKKYKNLAGAVVAAVKNDYAESDELSLFDEKPTSQSIVNAFLAEKMKEDIRGPMPSFILSDMFKKWVEGKYKLQGDLDIDKIWDENSKRIYKAINKFEPSLD